MIDVVYIKKDIIVLAGTDFGKSLPYQLISLIQANAVVLVVLSTIALMCDQVCFTIYSTMMSRISMLIVSSQHEYITQLGISAVALMAETTHDDPDVWSDIEKGRYLVVLASPKIVLSNGSVFWLQTTQQKENMFCRWLACIAVDEAYLI